MVERKIFIHCVPQRLSEQSRINIPNEKPLRKIQWNLQKLCRRIVSSKQCAQISCYGLLLPTIAKKKLLSLEWISSIQSSFLSFSFARLVLFLCSSPFHNQNKVLGKQTSKENFCMFYWMSLKFQMTWCLLFHVAAT